MFKLDKIDRLLLYELDQNSRLPETQLAKKINRSKESVRYRIKKLEDAGVIQGYTIWIDFVKLGYTSAKIYFNLANKPKRKREFIAYVNNDPRLFWLGVAEGAWNAGLTYFVRNNQEFFEMKNDILSKFKDLILDIKTGMLVDLKYSKKNFFVDKENNSWTTLFTPTTPYTLKQIERKLLQVLSKNARETLVSISKKIQASVDTVRSKMKYLEEIGIINRYTLRLHLPSFGYEFYKTFLYFNSLSKKDELRLLEYTKKIPQMIYFIKQISPWDIELESMCKNYQEYLEIINHLTQQFSDCISKVETAIMSEDYVSPAKKLIFE